MPLETIYTAVTGMTVISAGNTNLDGSRTTYNLLTGGANGTLIKSLIIKAQVKTDPGMVRFFIKNTHTGGDDIATLILEVSIPFITPTDIDCSYYNVIPINYSLQKDDVLFCSTAIANAFTIVAEGLDWEYPESYTEPSIEYTARIGSGN